MAQPETETGESGEKDPCPKLEPENHETSKTWAPKSGLEAKPGRTRTHLGSNPSGSGLCFAILFIGSRYNNDSQDVAAISGLTRGNLSMLAGRALCSDPAGAAVRESASAKSFSSALMCPTA